MRRISARDWVDLPPDHVWRLPDERFIMVFDDGEIETTTRRSIFSYYHWEVHRHYPKTPLRVAHHMGNDALSADTSLDILSACARDVHNTYGETIDREMLWKLFYEIANEIYNVFTVKLDAYQTSSNILDYLEIYDHPEVKAANAAVKDTQQSLDETYRIIGKVMREDQSLSHNPIARAVRSKLVKIDQVNQIIGPRGFMTDVDSNIFRKSIKQGFLEGITGLYESMIESCSAKKALIFTKKPLRQVEYFNRKMRLSTSNVKDLIMGDCESTEYITLTMTPELLKGMEGKYIRVKGKGLQAVARSDKHLIGQILQMRSPTKCRWRGGGNCCSTCMGEISYSIPRYTNLGHVSATEMCQEGSQLVLSVKHFDGSSKVEPMSISEHDSKFIYEGVEPGTIFLNGQLSTAGLSLIMDPISKPPCEGAAGLATLKSRADDIDDLSIHRVTSFHEVSLGYTNAEGNYIVDYIRVSEGGRLGSLSTEFLKYVIEEGYQITDDGMFKVDLDAWDFNECFMELPMRHLNMLDYMSDIEVFLRSPTEATRDVRIGASKKLIEYTSIDEALLDLYELASSKLSVNIAHLEVLLLSLMRSAADPNDYRIPDLYEPAMFERHSKLMEMRSLGAAMAYERQPAIIEDVDSYLVTNRDPHILDQLII